MNTCRTVLYSVATSVALMSFAFAQTPPQSNTTFTSAASSPHQRDTTSSPTPEASTTNGANPAAASSPHQRQVTSGPADQTNNKKGGKQTLKGCIAREQADHTGVSTADARKSCQEQLKAAPQK